MKYTNFTKEEKAKFLKNLREMEARIMRKIEERMKQIAKDEPN